jgi:hypothetical protein
MLRDRKVQIISPMIIMCSVKVGIMKVAVGIVIVLIGFTSAVQALSLLTNASLADISNPGSDSLANFKMKMADALSRVSHTTENSHNADNGLNSSELTNNSFDLNSSELKLPLFSQPPNSSLMNQSAENETKSDAIGRNWTVSGADSVNGGLSLSQSSAVSPSGIHLDNQGSFNGYWSMQASKHGIGRSGINDRMVLSGDFNVQKSVSFKE